MRKKLAEAWGVKEIDVDIILSALDAKRWLGGDTLAAITHAGSYDNSSTDKMCGHTGFWVSDGEYLAVSRNGGDPIWTTLGDEDTCTLAGLTFGEVIWDD